MMSVATASSLKVGLAAAFCSDGLVHCKFLACRLVDNRPFDAALPPALPARWYTNLSTALLILMQARLRRVSRPVPCGVDCQPEKETVDQECELVRPLDSDLCK